MSIERSTIEEPPGGDGKVPSQKVLLEVIEAARIKSDIAQAGREAEQFLRNIAEHPSERVGRMHERVNQEESGGSPLFERIRRNAPFVVGIGGAMGIAGLAAPEGVEAAPRVQEVRPAEQQKKSAIELTVEDKERAKQLAEHREIISGFLGKSGLALIDSLYQLKIESAKIGEQYSKDKKESRRIAMEIERSITHISHKIFQDIRRDPRLTPERLKRIQDAIQENVDRILRDTVPLSRADYNFLRAFSMKITKEVYDIASDKNRPNLVWERGTFAEGLLHRFSDRTAIIGGALYNNGVLHDVAPFPAPVVEVWRDFFTLQRISAEEYVRRLKQLITQKVAAVELHLTPVRMREKELPDF